jgi:4,5-DOPA dioxygenase extradiol
MTSPKPTPPVKMPVLFVGHGSSMNAIESNAFTRALERLGRHSPRPQAICVVSAHWVTRGSL